MAKKKNFMQKIGEKQGVLLLGALIIFGAIFAQQSGLLDTIMQQQVTTPEDPGANYFEVDATISFTVASLLNGTGMDTGTLTIYDPADPGVASMPTPING